VVSGYTSRNDCSNASKRASSGQEQATSENAETTDTNRVYEEGT
jgi:hypothetical protein